jgi:hypothetical protein
MEDSRAVSSGSRGSRRSTATVRRRRTSWTSCGPAPGGGGCGLDGREVMPERARSRMLRRRWLVT